MPIIKITSQAEWDALQDQFDEWTEIQIIATSHITVNRRPSNSSVVARDNSSVVARDNSSVVVRDNSSAVARDNSSVVARDNSSVEAWGNSSVEAWDNSSVVARDNSSVEAWGQVAARYFSTDARLSAHGQAVIFQYVNPAKSSHLKGEHIVKVKAPSTTDAWLSAHGVAADKNQNVILFKRVSADFKTQEGTLNETLWAVGSALEHPAWNPTKEECGDGKFHACPKTYFCDEFRSDKSDKYIAIQVAVKDLYVWPENPFYPHKVAFRAGIVLYECDKRGVKITEAA